MPHLHPLANSDAPATSIPQLETLETKLGGQVPNMYRTFAHAPKILAATVVMAQAIRSDLSARIRELAYLKVTQLTDCHVCRHYHELHGRKAGLSERQINELAYFQESDAYSELDKDILHFTTEWSERGRVRDEVLERLKSLLTSEELVILAATVSQANFTSRFNNVFGVELP